MIWPILVAHAGGIALGACGGWWLTVNSRSAWRRIDRAFKEGFADGYEHGKVCGYDDAIMDAETAMVPRSEDK